MTGRKTADAAEVAHTEALLHAIVEGTTDVVFVRDLEGRYVLANSAAARVNGVTVEALLYNDDSLLFPANVVRDIQEDDRRTIEGGVTRTFERTLQPRGGEARTYHVTKGPCCDRAGKVIGVFVISRDITERKHSEQERARLFEHQQTLREEAERARAEAESAAQALRALDQITEAALTSLAVDDLLQTLVDRIQAAFRVDTVAVLLVDDARQQVALRAGAGLEGVLEQGIRFPADRGIAGQIIVEGRPIIIDDLATADQATPHLWDRGVRSLMGAPLRHPDRALGVVHVGSFAPRRFTADEATLLLLAADRIAVALEHARLYDQARRAIQARDAVLAIVAHDLRNALNSVALHAQLTALRMQRAGVAEEECKGVEGILASARLMDRMVRDLLDVTRIEAGELALTLAPLAVEPLIAEAVELARPLTTDKSLQLETKIAGDLAKVRGDRERLLQVLGNLLDNAVKFTEPGGRITVAAERVGPDIRISVTDTGSGIREEHLPHVFDRYWRATASDQRHVGLGLSITQGLVRGHGGRIWVRSTVGVGSAFVVALPAAAEEAG